MKIMNKTVIRAEIQTWIGKGDISAQHYIGYLFDTESAKEFETKKECFTKEDALVETMKLFNEQYGLDDTILIFCSRAAFCTI